MKNVIGNGGGDGGNNGLISGSVLNYAALPSPASSYTGDLFYVQTGSGGILSALNVYKYPKGLYSPNDSDVWELLPFNVEVKAAEDSVTLVNISNWAEFVSYAFDISAGDRLIFNKSVYENRTGTLTSTDPSSDTTNWINRSRYFGDFEAGNYLDIEEDGTLVNIGAGSTWDDLVNSLVGRRLFSNTGTIDYDYYENAIKMQPNGNISSTSDRVIFDLQYPHAAVVDGAMNLHVHWFQETSNKIEFTVQYRIQKNNQPKTTAWTQVISNSDDDSAFTYTSGTLNQITNLASVDMTGAGISATVQFRFTRTDSTSGNILATFVDAHIERDMIGSREEFVK